VRNHYTAKEQTELLKSIVILTDSRENMNKHILDYLDKKGIKHKSMKLDFGDYSYMLPASEKFGIRRDIYFDNSIVIERKNSLNELSTNIGKKRVEFENELIRKGTCKFYLFVENGSYEDIRQEKYVYSKPYQKKEDMPKHLMPASFLGSLRSFETKYNIIIQFDTKESAGDYILDKMGRHLKEFLKNYY